MPDPIAVNSMFARIARRYDVANRVLSGGMDIWWRHRLVRAVRRSSPSDVLDLATGSGDVAFALAKSLPAATRITGADFCQPMLDVALEKQRERPGCEHIVFRQADAHSLPLADESIDALTIAFGFRNLADRARALAEFRRVLRPSGSIFILEFSQPARWFAPFYFFYLRHILPRLATLLTRDKAAYDYLCGSIEKFPTRREISQEILSAGFSTVEAESMACGAVALHCARK